MEYAAVFRNDTPLVQHCPSPGNFDLFFDKFMERYGIAIGRTIMLSEGFLWGIDKKSESLIFVCAIKSAYERNMLDKALDDIEYRFLRQCGDQWKDAKPFGLQSSFESQLVLVKKSLLSMSGIDEDRSIINSSLVLSDEPEDRSQTCIFRSIADDDNKKCMNIANFIISLSIIAIIVCFVVVII